MENEDWTGIEASKLGGLLSLFIKEIREPDNSQYRADKIFSNCLNLQSYFFHKGRNENIFFLPEYQVFVNCLNELINNFLALPTRKFFVILFSTKCSDNNFKK